MLPKIPFNLEKIKKEDTDREILRAGIAAEMDAINFYEQMAVLTENKDIKEILLEIVKGKKMHVGRFHALLVRKDKDQEKGLEEGKRWGDEISSAHKAVVKPPEEQKAIRPIPQTSEAEKPKAAPHSEAKDMVKSAADLGTEEINTCSVCGYKAKGEIPNRCPMCGAQRERFRGF